MCAEYVMAFSAKFVMSLCLVFVKMKYDRDVLKVKSDSIFKSPLYRTDRNTDLI